MNAGLLNVDDLPRQNATQVKNKWGDVVRLVHQAGSVAITNHSVVEMVMLDIETYRRLAAALDRVNAQEKTVVDELAERFNARLAVLNETGAAERVDALFAAKGQLKRRPKAGESY
ncbi:hypothetical protein SJI19_15405 [Acerihabitans sp. TG2]|uniref:hypothetical protein n=1 Tax=Acerihabitans sp. TG2 TaxID=3096008 RepID=UPI002B23E34E|nr:hypothetical protein [Acerihabitans sp. TG2]MEA9391913.1 hypothetical protein [Acerihabitans sp. TG2]